MNRADALKEPETPSRPVVEVRASVPAAVLGLAGESQGIWSKVVRHAGASSPIMRAVLTNASLESVEGDAAVVTCSARFIAGARKMQGAIAEALSRELGREVKLDLREVGESGQRGETPDGEGAVRQGASAEESAAPAGQVAPSERAEETPKAVFNPNIAMENALVKQAMELFGARVVDVRPR